ncbi:MAG TPA: cytochrome c3 family protein [Bryobacterales bacterium]|nr:cytochrome c3 family protein [Bryobacterales bacterium]
MSSRDLTIILFLGLVGSLLALVPGLRSIHLPGNQQSYEPEQPIAFSHRLHAGELQVGCLYCHSGAETSRHAGIPAASTCMNCHRFVTAPLGSINAEEELAKKDGRKPRPVIAPELSKLYQALALDPGMKRDPAGTPRPIAWTRVHSLPDFVYFDHRPHVAAGVKCQTCHGPVETMDRVRQVSDLSMGWCVNCHRDATANGIEGKKVFASTDCATCHY